MKLKKLILIAMVAIWSLGVYGAEELTKLTPIQVNKINKLAEKIDNISKNADIGDNKAKSLKEIKQSLEIIKKQGVTNAKVDKNIDMINKTLDTKIDLTPSLRVQLNDTSRKLNEEIRAINTAVEEIR